jgi:hypothetical protein
MRSPFLLALGLSLGLATTALAEDVVKLKAGETKLWSPGYASMRIHCDDLSIVGVEDAGSQLRLRGIRPGRTLCAFYSTPAHKRLVTIIVRDPKAKDDESEEN